MNKEQQLEQDVARAQTVGNGLYLAILDRMKSFFPEGDRGLDWDVLPSTIYGVCKENQELKKQIEDISALLESASNKLLESARPFDDGCFLVRKSLDKIKK